MSKRDLSPVSKNEKRRPLQQRKSISDEIGPLLVGQCNLDFGPHVDENLASRQSEAGSRQNSTGSSISMISESDGLGSLESKSETNPEDAIEALSRWAAGDRGEPNVSGKDLVDSSTTYTPLSPPADFKTGTYTPLSPPADFKTGTYTLLSPPADFKTRPPLERQAKVHQPRQQRTGDGDVVWIRHQSESNSDSDRYMKITNTVTMVTQPNDECNLYRKDFDSCTEDPLSHVVFQKASTGATQQKTLAITSESENNYSVGVGNTSGLDGSKGVTPAQDARFFRLHYPFGADQGEVVLLELCKHHEYFLAYEEDRLEVLQYTNDLTLAGAKFCFQIVSPGDDDDSDNNSDDDSSSGGD